jgi:hypothetical protein
MKLYIYTYGKKLTRFDETIKKIRNDSLFGYELITSKEYVSISLLNSNSFVVTGSLYPWNKKQIKKFIDFCETQISKNKINKSYL